MGRIRGNVHNGLHIPYTIKDGLSEPLLNKVNALAIWDPGDDWSALHSNLVVQLANQLSKDICWPVAPAFYQRRAGLNPWECGNEFGAARYIDAWMKALTIHPAIIDVQTGTILAKTVRSVPLTPRAIRTWT